MDNEIIISLKNITKVYKLKKRSKNSLKKVFKDDIKNAKKALDDITLDIKKGETVALIGKNGAGKSTLLKIISQVAYPTYGDIFVNGKIAALIELAAGFDMQLTGIENIKLNYVLRNIKYENYEDYEKKVIEFTDIGEYIYEPLRTYSSGMRARLGFAINIFSNSDIFLIDEALSVGDAEFKQKCINIMKKLQKDQDKTFVFVTHNLELTRLFCKRGIVIIKGKVEFDGALDDALKFYNEKCNKNITNIKELN